MPHSVRHDPFARGAFTRTCRGPGRCAWCGQKRKRVFTYVWVNDDSPNGQPSIFARHQANHAFCNFECFHAYHS